MVRASSTSPSRSAAATWSLTCTLRCGPYAPSSTTASEFSSRAPTQGVSRDDSARTPFHHAPSLFRVGCIPMRPIDAQEFRAVLPVGAVNLVRGRELCRHRRPPWGHRGSQYGRWRPAVAPYRLGSTAAADADAAATQADRRTTRQRAGSFMGQSLTRRSRFPIRTRRTAAPQDCRS
jgi:hypothetical protein